MITPLDHAAFGYDVLGTTTTITLSAIQALAAENSALKIQLAERDARDVEQNASLAKLESVLPADSVPVKVVTTKETARR